MHSRALDQLHTKNMIAIIGLILPHFLCIALLCTLSACSRSPLDGSAQFDCGDGDRVISAEHLFCVYRSPRSAREDPDQGGETSAGEMSAGTNADEREAIAQCPLETPHLYVYDTLYICSAERVVSDEIIESAAATWLREYDDANDDNEDEGGEETDSGIGTLELDDQSGGTSASGGAPPSPIGLVDQGVSPERP